MIPKSRGSRATAVEGPLKTVLTAVSSQVAAEAEPVTVRKAVAPTSMLTLPPLPTPLNFCVIVSLHNTMAKHFLELCRHL